MCASRGGGDDGCWVEEAEMTGEGDEGDILDNSAMNLIWVTLKMDLGSCGC